MIAGGSALLLSFAIRSRFSRADGVSLPLILELATFLCTLDLLSDLTYIVISTFATPQLYIAAVLIMAITLVVPALLYFFSAYKVCTKKNLAWRWLKGRDFAASVWVSCLKTKQEGAPDTWRWLLIGISLGTLPIAVAVASGLAAAAPFVTLPVEVLWQPFRIAGAVTASAVTWMFGKAWASGKELAKGSIFGLLLVAVFGPLLTLLVVLLAVTTLVVMGLTTPFLYGLCIMFRAFILIPPAWAGMRALTGYLLKHVHKPKDEGIFAWEPVEEASIDGIVDRLFGPKQDAVDGPLTDKQKGNQASGNVRQAEFCLRILAGSLVFEFLCETVPQLIVQGMNNDLRSTWNAFTITSFIISLGVGLDTVYRIGVNVFYDRFRIGSPQAMGIRKVDALKKLGFQVDEDTIETFEAQMRWDGLSSMCMRAAGDLEAPVFPSGELLPHGTGTVVQNPMFDGDHGNEYIDVNGNDTTHAPNNGLGAGTDTHASETESIAEDADAQSESSFGSNGVDDVATDTDTDASETENTTENAHPETSFGFTDSANDTITGIDASKTESMRATTCPNATCSSTSPGLGAFCQHCGTKL